MAVLVPRENRLGLCVVLIGHLFTSNASADHTKPVDRKGSELSTFIAFDSFEGKAQLKWQPIRHVPSHMSFTKNPGDLTITTQRGSIHRDERNDAFGEGIQAKNIFLIDNPLAAETDFVLTTCVTGFTPATIYQQAGLIIYNDDDNYLKWGYEFNWPNGVGQAFCILLETDANSEFTYVDSPPGLDKYWVRLTKRGNRYEYAFSTDGKEFKVQGEQQWGDVAPKRMGLLAKNGGNKEAGELDAQFEFFEFRSPVPADGCLSRLQNFVPPFDHATRIEPSRCRVLSSFAEPLTTPRLPCGEWCELFLPPDIVMPADMLGNEPPSIRTDTDPVFVRQTDDGAGVPCTATCDRLAAC